MTAATIAQVEAVDHQQVAGAGAGQVVAHLRGDLPLVPQQHGEIDGPQVRVQALKHLADAAAQFFAQGVASTVSEKDQVGAVLEAQLPEDAVRGQEPGPVEGPGIF